MAETIEAIATQQQIDIPRRDDTFLVARNQMELQGAQARMVSWFSAEIQRLEADAKELNESIEIATRNRWRRGTMQKHLKYALDKILFFEKCKSAAAEGYAIIPDMPCDVFAIRVEDDGTPSHEHTDSRYASSRWLPDQTSDVLAEGQGTYVSPQTTARDGFYHTTDDKGNKVPHFIRTSKDYQPLVFPIIAVKPKIMEAAQAAMALRIFDEVAVVPANRRKKDPMIVGRIIDPKGERLSFIVAWFLDLETLR